MNLSKTKIGIFFLVLILTGWFLYPREIFLASLYEGKGDFVNAEFFFLKRLEKKPGNKFAALRLFNLYEEMGEPDEAKALLKNLYTQRPIDLEVAEKYIELLQNLHEEKELAQVKMELALNLLKKSKHSPKIQELLHSALQYATWHQEREESYEILQTLVEISRNQGPYEEMLENTIWGLKDPDKIVELLKKKLAANPKDESSRIQLVNLLISLDKVTQGFALLEEGLTLSPESIQLLKTEISLNEKFHRDVKNIKAITRLLASGQLTPNERIGFMNELATLYSRRGNPNQTLELYKEILKENNQDPSIWQTIIYTLLSVNRTDEAVSFLKEYITRFPNDFERKKVLADIYLYEKKDIGQTPLYLDCVKKQADLRFAMDVIYLLNESANQEQLAQWLSSVHPFFLGNIEIANQLIDLYLQKGMIKEALSVGLDFIEFHPDSSLMLLRVAELYRKLSDPKKAGIYYEKLAQLKPNVDTLKIVGKEMFFLENQDRALFYLNKASHIDPADPEIWFWLSEVNASLGNQHQANLDSKKVLALTEEKNLEFGSDEELTRAHLKSKGRVDFNPHLEEEYQKAKNQYASNFDLHADWIQTLIENKEFKKAQSAVNDLFHQFPGEKKRIAFLELQLFTTQKDWDRVTLILEELIQSNPNDLSLRRDLAYAYSQKGEWKKAMSEYEKIKNTLKNKEKINSLYFIPSNIYLASADNDAGIWEKYYAELQQNSDLPQIEKQAPTQSVTEELSLLEPLWELHETYDHRITPYFQLRDFESERALEWGTSYSGFISQNWRIFGDITLGNYKVPNLNFEEEAGFGQLSLKRYHLKKWIFEGGVKPGFSSLRKTVAPFIDLGYRPTEKSFLSLGSKFRSLRTDLPQAVAAGAFQDEVKFGWDYQIIERLNFLGNYTFDRSYLPGGAKGLSHTIEPSLSYLILKKPELRLGYQYSFVDVTEKNNFLTQVPLIPRVQAHYLTGSVNHRIQKLLLEASFYVGEDTERDLHIYEGDLLGMGALFKVNLLSWLDFESSYNFARESLTGISGEYHQLGVFVSGHWK